MYITRTAKKTITAQDIKQIKIPMPRKSLQEKFAQIVQKIERLHAQKREAER
jgi:restriction endonuclease S subunit